MTMIDDDLVRLQGMNKDRSKPMIARGGRDLCGKLTPRDKLRTDCDSATASSSDLNHVTYVGNEVLVALCFVAHAQHSTSMFMSCRCHTELIMMGNLKDSC